MQWPPPFPPDLESLALCREQTAVLRAWEPEEQALVLGRGSKFEEEVNLTAWNANPVPVYRRLGGGLLFGASLLVSNPLEPICHYLRHPPREPEYRQGRPHAHFLVRLADIHAGLTAPALADALARELPRAPGSPFGVAFSITRSVLRG